MIVREVGGASEGLNARFPDLRLIGMETLDAENRARLLDAHVISVEQTQSKGAAVILEPSATLSIMVNEEDHIRIQVLRSGLAPNEAWELADWVDDVLGAKLQYGYSGRYGFLTASVSNVGTGLRLSAMMHLAGLALTNRLAPQLRAAYDLGVSIRGMFGEGTRPAGDMYQVSNEVTLGLSEREIVQRVTSVAQYLLAEERHARKELLNEERTRLMENARKSLDVLQYVRSIDAGKAIALISPLRLGAAVGLVEDCPIDLLNELLAGMRVGAVDDIRAAQDRAELLRRRLARVSIVG